LAAVPSTGRADQADRAAAPEADATRALYERYANQIFGYCLHQLGSREEAEDAVQSTFLNAFRGLRRGVVPELEAAWLFKIAHNVCLSRRRSSWRRGRIESPADFDLVEELAPAPARQSDELIGLQDVLETMPENQRRAILLREWQGLSYREIGDELELSQAAVETLIFRARRSLAQGLEQPPKPARRRARAAGDFGNILAGIKSLLFSGAAAVKVAATVAVVSATTVAVTAPVQQQRQHHKASAPRTPSSAAASAQRGGPALAPSPAAVLAHGKVAAAKHSRPAASGAGLGLPSLAATTTGDGTAPATDPQSTTTTPESQPASEPAAQPQAPPAAPASAPPAAPAAPATPASSPPVTPTKAPEQGAGDGGTSFTPTPVTTVTPTAPVSQTNGSMTTTPLSPPKAPIPYAPNPGTGSSDSPTTTVVTLLNPKNGPPVANTDSSTPPLTTTTTTTSTGTVTGKKLPATTSMSLSNS
jgi:RNA polymerase sigma factor (sigma-70 family)